MKKCGRTKGAYGTFSKEKKDRTLKKRRKVFRRRPNPLSNANNHHRHTHYSFHHQISSIWKSLCAVCIVSNFNKIKSIHMTLRPASRVKHPNSCQMDLVVVKVKKISSLRRRRKCWVKAIKRIHHKNYIPHWTKTLVLTHNNRSYSRCGALRMPLACLWWINKRRLRAVKVTNLLTLCNLKTKTRPKVMTQIRSSAQPLAITAFTKPAKKHNKPNRKERKAIVSSRDAIGKGMGLHISANLCLKNG